MKYVCTSVGRAANHEGVGPTNNSEAMTEAAISGAVAASDTIDAGRAAKRDAVAAALFTKSGMNSFHECGRTHGSTVRLHRRSTNSDVLLKTSGLPFSLHDMKTHESIFRLKPNTVLKVETSDPQPKRDDIINHEKGLETIVERRVAHRWRQCDKHTCKD